MIVNLKLQSQLVALRYRSQANCLEKVQEFFWNHLDTRHPQTVPKYLEYFIYDS